MKRQIRLTESELHRLVENTVKNILRESEADEDEYYDNYLYYSTVQRLANGEDPSDIFDRFGDFNEGYAVVEMDWHWNFIDKELNLLSKQWFDWVGDFHNGYAIVDLAENWNFIDTKGNILYGNPNGINTWFDDVQYFNKNGYARVKLNNKWNFIDTKGNFLYGDHNDTNTWLDIEEFYKGYARVKLNNKWNLIDKGGNILYGDLNDTNTWLDWVGSVEDGYAMAILNGNYYRLDTKGKLYYICNKDDFKKSKK